MDISQNIKRLREEYGITQAELAKIAGVTNKAVSMWEMGNSEPRMGAVQKIADYFGIKKSDVIDGFVRRDDAPKFSVNETLIITLFRMLDDAHKEEAERYLKKLAEECAK